MKHITSFLITTLLLFFFSQSAFCADAKFEPTQWEPAITAFEENDRMTPPPKGAVLFIGSSHVHRWTTISTDYPEITVINRGFGGSYIRDATYYAERIVFPYAPKTIYLRSGSNELWHQKRSVDEAFNDYKEFVAVVHAKLPQAEIVYISNIRTIARVSKANEEERLNLFISKYVQGNPRLRYVDVFDIAVDASGQLRPECFVEDQLHLSTVGYQLLAEGVRGDVYRSQAEAWPRSKQSQPRRGTKETTRSAERSFF